MVAQLKVADDKPVPKIRNDRGTLADYLMGLEEYYVSDLSPMGAYYLFRKKSPGSKNNRDIVAGKYSDNKWEVYQNVVGPLDIQNYFISRASQSSIVDPQLPDNNSRHYRIF